MLLNQLSELSATRNPQIYSVFLFLLKIIHRYAIPTYLLVYLLPACFYNLSGLKVLRKEKQNNTDNTINTVESKGGKDPSVDRPHSFL